MEPDTKHGTVTHDCLTTAMLSNAQTVNFIPRICMQKISGGQWRTFYHFASYKEAPTTGLQDIKRGNSLRKVDSDATHDFLLPPPPEPGVQGWRQKCTFICKPKPQRFEAYFIGKNNETRSDQAQCTHTTPHQMHEKKTEGNTSQNHTTQMECCRRH